MEFQRARNEEQKEQRTSQILQAAAELFETHAYHEITLVMIAERLNFSRINMYKYILNKDDIFIKMFVRDLTAWVEDVSGAYRSQGQTMDIPAFSSFWAEVLNRHRRYMKIFSIMNTVIEKNIPAEKLTQYQKEIFRIFYRLEELICGNFSFLDRQKAQELLFIQKNFMCGLYPLENLSPLQQESIRNSGIEYPDQQFVPSMTRFMTLLLKGYETMRETEIV